MTDWVNDDGLRVRFGPAVNASGSPSVETGPGNIETMVFEIGVDTDGNALPTPAELFLSGDTTQAYFVEGDHILEGWIVVDEVFVTATALTLSLQEADGSTGVTSSALDTAVSLAAVGATAMDGTQIGASVAAMTDDPAYVAGGYTGGAPTGGRGRVIIKYIPNLVNRATRLVSEAS